jgi:ATP-binding cassette subfamily B (MDR/TAP) protein 8
MALLIYQSLRRRVSMTRSLLQIPQLLGDIVNVVAEFARSDPAGGSSDAAVQSFLAQIRDPALHMVKLYVAQSALTFAYIYSLSCVGERHHHFAA